MAAATKAQLIEANTKLKREIDAGKYNGKKHKWATNKYHSINYKIRNYGSNKVAKQIKKSPKLTAPPEMQGQLPGFLDQMNNVRIEEMVREAIFKRVSTRVDEVVDRLLGGGKKHG